MNTLKPMQRKNDLKWDYTCNGIPTGYCRPYRDMSDIPMSENRRAQFQAMAHKHHDHGHETAQEAADCYKDYLMDHRLQFSRGSNNTQRKCKVCGEWTQKWAQIDAYEIMHLCDKHLNRESVEKLYTLSGEDEMWSS